MTPLRVFKNLSYRGNLMMKKLRDRSQYYPDYEHMVFDLEFNSQTGAGYTLASLGDVDEAYDRLAKYDIEDQPLDNYRAQLAIDTFLDRLPDIDTLTFEGAIDSMDLSKSTGFGATRGKIRSRKDPEMLKYFRDYCDTVQKGYHNVIVNASQKDEVRVEGKTARLFMSFPPEHTLSATMVLGPFMDAWIDDSFCKTGGISTVGDAIQNGAAAWYKEKLSHFPHTYCTDTSGQDSSVSPKFIDMVYSSIKLKMDLDEYEDNLFENVRYNSINKLVNINGDLYMVNRGLGSGDYLTIVINIMWRYYLFVENYKHDLQHIRTDNIVAICGDDYIASSKYDDLDLNSRHAKIEWAGKPVPWSDMDFCSIKFHPYVHHDELKVMSVLNLRKKKIHMMSPELEMQRLGGILRVLSTPAVYQEVLRRMDLLLNKNPELLSSYQSLYISYEDLYDTYNYYLEYN